MKLTNKIISVLALFASVSCASEVEPLHLTAPKVLFPMIEENMTVTLGETVVFTAEIDAGDRLTAGWYVDGTMMSSGERLEYVFTEAGTYDVMFEARNGEGVVSKTYRVTVGDILKMHLSVEDSTEIKRLQGTYLRLMAVVDYGSGVTHSWSVDGDVKSDKAYFNSFFMPDAVSHKVKYEGRNSVGTFTKEFTVAVQPRPLFVSFSNNDATLAAEAGTPVEITANVEYGEQGLSYVWTADGAVVKEGNEKVSVLSYSFSTEGSHVLAYDASNSKGEKFSKEWLVNVTLPGVYMLDNFEIGTLGGWWIQGNSPGISVVDNPDRSGINTSDKVIINQVAGTGGTSGFFDLNLGKFSSGKDVDFSKFRGMRFKVHLGNNKYYPRIDISGTKYPSVKEPEFKNEWEVLTYRFPDGVKLSNTMTIKIRAMLNKDGSNISGGSGFGDATNNRTQYFDDFEFLEVL